MPLRSCHVSVQDVEGITHSVEVQAESLFEAAAAAMALFKQHGWATSALTPRAALRIEVQLPSVVHEVPLAAVERWVRSTTVSPKGETPKGAIRGPQLRS